MVFTDSGEKLVGLYFNSRKAFIVGILQTAGIQSVKFESKGRGNVYWMLQLMAERVRENIHTLDSVHKTLCKICIF